MTFGLKGLVRPCRQGELCSLYRSHCWGTLGEAKPDCPHGKNLYEHIYARYMQHIQYAIVRVIYVAICAYMWIYRTYMCPIYPEQKQQNRDYEAFSG